MEDKDPKDEELNPQGQDDANDADDSFGLPDLDYKTLDEEQEEGVSDVEDEETTTSEEEIETETNYTYDSSEESEEIVEEEKEKPQLRYQIDESKSNAPKVIIGILIILVVAAGIWFFGYYQPQQKKLAEEEKARQEEIDRKKAEEAAAKKREQEAAAAAAAEEQRLREEAEARAKAGAVAITERTGRYYIVVGSFVDADLAKDYGDRIAKSGTPSFLIPPYSKKKLQRVAIGGYDTFNQAQSTLNAGMPEGVKGSGNWILKY